MGKGIPTFGDRSAWDAAGYATRHANDIDNGIHWTLTKLQELFAAVGHTHAHFTDTSNPHSVTKAQVGLGNVANVLCNLTGTAAPGVNDDSAAGYSVGSWWFYNNKYYDCLDATSGAAVWQERGSGSGGSITVEEIDGTPSVASVSKIKVTNGKLTDNGSGTVTLDLGGGSSGDSSILGYCSSTSNSVVDPDPATDTDVDSMSISLTLSATKLVVITIRIIKSGGHPDRYAIYDGATKIFPVNGISSGYYDHSSAENGEYSITHVCYVSLASGSHTIKIKHQAAQSTSSITFKERWMVITDGAYSGVGGYWAAPSKPALSNFAWINQGTATAAENGDGIYLLAPAVSGDNLRVLKKSAPATPYTITAMILPMYYPQNYNQCGLCWRQSSDGKLVTFDVSNNGGLKLETLKFNGPSSFNAAYTQIGFNYICPIWLRIADDGTNRITSWSLDGYNFMQVYSVGRTDFMTADEVGFYANSCNGTYPAAIKLLSWKEEAS